MALTPQKNIRIADLGPRKSDPFARKNQIPAAGSGGTAIDKSTQIPPASDDDTGAIGTSTDYAAANHKHPAQGPSADAFNRIAAGADGLHFYSGSTKTFVSNGAVGPATPGSPTDSEILAAAGAGVVRDILVYYTQTDIPADPATHVFYIDSAGQITRLQEPSGSSDNYVTTDLTSTAARTHTFDDDIIETGAGAKQAQSIDATNNGDVQANAALGFSRISMGNLAGTVGSSVGTLADGTVEIASLQGAYKFGVGATPTLPADRVAQTTRSLGVDGATGDILLVDAGAWQEINADQAITAADFINGEARFSVDSSAGVVTLTIADALTDDFVVYLTRNGGNDVVIATAAAETVAGDVTGTMNINQATIGLQKSGTNWSPVLYG